MVSLIYQNHGYEAGGWGVTKGSSLRHGIRLAACRLLADGQAFSRGEYVKLSFYILKLRLKRLEVASFKAKISSEPDALAYKLGGL